MADRSSWGPRPFVMLSTVVLLAGIAAMLASWRYLVPSMTVQLGLVLLGAVLSEFFAFSFSVFRMSLAYPLGLCAAMLSGPAAACMVAVVSSVSFQELRDRRPPTILGFNLGQLLLSAAAGAWAYVLCGGRVLEQGEYYLPLQVSDFPAAFFAMAAAAVACHAVNQFLTSAGIAAYDRRSSYRHTFEAAIAVVPTQLALAFVGFLMAQVLAINALAFPLFVFPLLVARQLYQSYSGLKSAYADTIRSLIGALEAKDPYTKGHSERVAMYSVMIGKELALDEGSLDKLEYAALLHDLGKLEMPSELLTKPGSLSDAEFASMRRHPQAGAGMVDRIPPLKGLAESVLQHHERFGGGGYPLGSSGANIPRTARLLAVADAYDAMTTQRAYRPAMDHANAIEELISGCGSQFDPDAVSAFVRAFESHAAICPAQGVRARPAVPSEASCTQ